MKKPSKFSPEVRERAVRLVQEHRGEYPSLWSAIESIAPKIGCVPQTLQRMGQAVDEVDAGARPGVTYTSRPAAPEGASNARTRNCGRANEILKLASAFFAQAELDRRLKSCMDFIDQHRNTHGVEPICKVLQIAPSGYSAARSPMQP